MPYNIRKQKCKRSDGGSGSYVLSYTDKKGKKHRNCHTSRKKAKGQIAAIEAEGLRRFVQGVLAEEALGLHGAGMSEKDLQSSLGVGGIELNKDGPVTDEEADAIAKKVSEEKPDQIFAYSRGAAALSKAALASDMPSLPPVTYVAPAALRKWTDAPIPSVPGGSKTIIGDKDAAVPVKQACKIAKQAGTPLYVFPNKSHKSILYTKGELSSDSYEVDVDDCINDDELPDWGRSALASPEEVVKQQGLVSKYRKGGNDIKKEGYLPSMDNRNMLKSLIRNVIQEMMQEKLDPVGREDKDVDNDGEVTDTDDYLLNRREKIAKAMQKS